LFKLYVLTIISLLLLSGCASKNLLENSAELKNITKKEKTKPKRDYRHYSYEYRISPHDRLMVSIYNHKELSSTNMLVNSRGIVNLPLVNSVKISGLTQTQASKKIQALYSKYLKYANVNLEVINKKAYIIGEVRAPGSFPLLNDQIGLLQAIASRGGFSDNANREKLVIIRKTRGHPRLEIVDLTNITSLSYTSMMIRADDIIYIPSTNIKIAGISLYPLMGLINATLGTYIKIRDIND